MSLIDVRYLNLTCVEVEVRDFWSICLKEACFKVIIQQFERFYFAFKTSNDQSLQKHLKFLQRKYSFQLLTHLFHEEYLKDEYVDFLINEHLTFLYCFLFKNSRYRKFMDKIFRHLPNLTTVHFHNYNCDKDLRSIVEFCPKIVEFHVSNSCVTDNGIKYLWERKENGSIPCPNLKTISINGTSITNEGIKCLIRNLPSLEKIDNTDVPLIFYSLHKEDIKNLENVQRYNLLSLNLNEFRDLPYYKDLLEICLTVCSNLKSIKCHISDEEDLNLFRNTCLETVHLEFSKLDRQISLSNFLKNNRYNLMDLTLINCIMTIANLAVHCPKLKYLHLNNITFADVKDIDSKSIFHCLTSCYFENIKDDNLTSKVICLILLTSPNLTTIGFSHCVLSSDIKTHIIKYCENHPVITVSLEGRIADLHFFKRILFSCPSLWTVWSWGSFHSNELREISEILKKLPNKPDLWRL